MRIRAYYFLIALLLLILSACDSSETNIGHPEAYLPAGATTIVELNDLPTFLAEIKQNQLLRAAESSMQFTQLVNETPFLSFTMPQAESYLAYEKPNDSTQVITLVTHQHARVFETDSIPGVQVETQVLENGEKTHKVIIDNKAAFYGFKDSLFIASNSEPALRELLKGNTLQDTHFDKIARVHENDDAILISQNSSLSLAGEQIDNFAKWTSTELQITSNSVIGTGVVMAMDSTALLDVFKGQIPQQNDLELLIPNNSESAHSFTFSDAPLLQQNIRQYRTDTIANTGVPLFDSVNEIGFIQLKEGRALVLKSIDPDITQDECAPYLSANTTFKEVLINDWSAPQLFASTFAPLVPDMNATVAFQLDQFYVFTESISTAEQIITAFKNNNSLATAPAFNDALNHIGNASSLLLYELKNAPNVLQQLFSTKGSSPATQKTKNHPLSLVQYSYDRNFAHMHLVCQEATKVSQSSEGVSEQFSLSMEQPVLVGPFFFTNHRTKKKDMVVQDASNILHLISDKGTITWSKKLSEPILGKITEVDMLRNGKKQLVFSTKKALHVWDRNGNPVAPFPIKFKDEITQPVSVFDYDNNRKYRFLVTQDNELYMYDAKGKIVKGFTFKKTKTTIVLPPQHLRIGNKDYISVAEESGKLNLLSRTGKERVNVQEKFSFGDNNILKEGSQFLVITSDQQLKRISSTGKITSEATPDSEGYAYTALGTTKVSLDDNLLRINKKLVELPFGIYTSPSISILNRKTYITTTETQENKVYVYDKAGNLLSGFPVYGSGPAQLTKITNSQKGILVQGDEQTIIFYSLR